MLCYKCHTKMIKKIYNNVIIDFCNCCGGIWLNKNQLEKILFNLSKAKKNQLLICIKKQIKKQQKKITYFNICPECSYKKLSTKYIFNIQIQQCQHCKSIYLDYNQLEKIIKNYNKKSFISRIILKLKYTAKTIFI